MKIVQILYTKFNKEQSDSSFEEYLSLLPQTLQEKNRKYRRWQDRHSNLFGKLLLLKGLNDYGFSNNVLCKLQYNKHSRPYIDGNVDFNISHSGEYVVCVIGEGIKLGVDIEEIKDIDFSDFKKVMTDEQWREINHTQNPMESFFRYWTIKESVIKADSRGLSIPLLDIYIDVDKVDYEGQKWYLKELKIDKKYSSYLAINSPDTTLEIKEVDYYNYECYDQTFLNKINKAFISMI
jgi:4'-phosphopantetheinyl transferase